jgi:hypothetical protein
MAELYTASTSPEDVAPPAEETPTPTPVPETPPADTPPVTPEVPPDAPPATPDVDLDDAAQELLTDGELSEATLEALKARGFTKAQAEVYAAGIKAQSEQAVAKLADRVGGKEALDSMMAWARTALSDGERAAYDGLMATGNEAQMQWALDGLQARYQRSTGVIPSRITGQQAPREVGPQPFNSRGEVVAAMRDPRYAKDEAYRQSVAQRLAASDDTAIIR